MSGNSLIMYICSECGGQADSYEVDKKIENVNGIRYDHMRLCEDCFETTSECALCEGNVISKTRSDTRYKLCHNCRCLFIYHTGKDPVPLNL